MLTIKDLYKDKMNQSLKGLTFQAEKGSSISLECSNETSALLADIILGKELPARGEVLIDSLTPKDYCRRHPGTIGVIFKEDPLYEKMTVEGYLSFFYKLFNSDMDYRDVMQKLALLDLGTVMIKNLSYSQKRRISLAREILKNPVLFIFQEPILNMDRDGARLIIESIKELCTKGTTFLLTSLHLKDAILVGDKAYRLDEDGCVEINNNELPISGRITADEDKKTYTIEKIPAKIEDKILLFDPMEIDYIESEDGFSCLFVRGEKFPSSLSMTELEERLKYFGFFRSHRSYLVNLQRVREVITWSRNSYSLNLDDKPRSSIPLSKGRLEELKDILKL
ncbi:LytTR family transcriptional regulator DNA-binding domain-containing protein [Anaerocolumna xylanovorans]|uniref:Transcriptional regulator, LytTR family n=1 Tax=Anaerocolumna xylanovorans DSM 12503 TaxID=1121345 RepID=A0A1M7YDF8_9FIRM|nr:LytTR family transcriptional regulator DNA-binding domain-containing protein [Anaerocolumna xylanovorans]SHO50548.1 transcriptional regulator, LytTR family [Anaerocolumna xylanovorans DSM 12503]